MNRIKVLVADDHKLVAEGLSKLLETEFECVGIVTDSTGVSSAAERLSPEIILLDISMQPISGLQIAKELTASHPEIKVLFVTMRAGPEYLQEAFRSGGSGYILKSAAGSELIAAVRQISRGGTFVGSGLSLPVTLSRTGQPRGLTNRQRQVLQLIAEGTSGKEIAGTLGISPKTVEFHRLAMMRSLGAKTTAELIRYAVENGVVGSTLEGAYKDQRSMNPSL